MRPFLARHPILGFFLLAFAISWLIWIPGLFVFRTALAAGELPVAVLLLGLAGAYGPSVAALIMAAANGGGAEVRALLARVAIWRVNPLWYAVALFLPAAWLLTALGLYALTGGALGRFVPDGWPLLVLGTLLFAIPFGPLAEELGWRGYALPRLQSAHGALVASLALGTLWTFWHLPLFWVPGAALAPHLPLDAWTVGEYWLGTTATACVFTWLANNTRASVLLAILLHTAVNASGQILFGLFPDLGPAAFDQVHWIALVLKWLLVAALGIFALTRRAATPAVAEGARP